MQHGGSSRTRGLRPRRGSRRRRQSSTKGTSSHGRRARQIGLSALPPPPFARYQRFSGSTRKRALDLCAARGAKFSGLSSAWAPFLVAAASLLRPGGRMAFVVPAEIGHAPYSAPLLGCLPGHFEVIQLIAVREKISPALSEDCWLLFAEGFGGATGEIRLSRLDRFVYRPAPPDEHAAVPLCELRRWDFRLRPLLLPSEVRWL